MSKFRRITFTLLVAGGLSLAVMPISSAMAQDEGGSGLFSGLFNPGASTAGAKPLFVKPNVKAPTGLRTTGTASATGVARAPTSSYKSPSVDLSQYSQLSREDRNKMSLQEILDMETAKQNASTNEFVERKRKEAEEVAEMYRKQMEEQLAAQENPSASQSVGGGGTMGMNDEQVRKMVYKKKDNSPTSTGAKPIRLFKVQ